MSSASEPGPVPFSQTRRFWILMGYALLLGVVGAVAGLVFLGVTDVGNNWYDVSDPGWFGGQWWWVAVTAGAGVVVGLLRSLTKLPAKIPGLVADIEGAACRYRARPWDRGGLSRVTDRRRKPRTGASTWHDGRRCRHVDGPAEGPRQGRR